MAEKKSGLSGLQRRFAEAKVKREAEQDEEQQQRRARARQLGITAGCLGAGVALFIGSTVISTMASAESDRHEAELFDPEQGRAVEITDAQDRIYAAEDSEALLPDEADVERWLSRADEAGESIAEMQNTFLDQTGPLTVEDGPLYDEEELPSRLDPDDPDDEEDLEEYLYSDEERLELAEDERESTVNMLPRHLSPYIATGSRDHQGFDAGSRWDLLIETISDYDDEVSLEDYQWVYDEAVIYSPSGAVPISWRLVDGDENVVAVMVAQFSPQPQVMQDFELHVVADYDQPGVDDVEAD